MKENIIFNGTKQIPNQLISLTTAAFKDLPLQRPLLTFTHKI